MRKFLFCAILGMTSVLTAMAGDVQITMNAISTTMTLAEKTTGTPVEVGSPANKVYNFTAPAGTYVLTAYDTDGTTVNGSLEIAVGDEALELVVYTVTAYATNSGWAYGTDYTIDYKVISKTGVEQTVVMGDSKTAGRKTVLALNGCSYFFDYVPSAARVAEGFTTGFKNGTVTFNATASMAVPVAHVASITAPVGATVFVGRKTAHFVPFIEIPADSTQAGTHFYTIASGMDYNYRVMKAGKLTQGGIFNSNNATINVTDADMDAKSPLWIDHNVASNGGYNVADIFLNINAQEHLKMAVGEQFDLITLRNWEVVNSITANYFIEPDYHFFITDLNGQADSSIVSVDAEGNLHALAAGTAIVTVTYDAIRLPGMAGGEFWSAIWPENTGVFVVTVGAPASGIELGMTINETNTTKYKLAGTAYDADFDVLYFPDTTTFTTYTFHPTNVQSVKVAYPTIGTNAATYNGFGTEGVSYDSQTGDYTVQVRFGRQIVQLTNASGVSEYQVLVGKPVHIETIAAGREQTGNFQPGDKITVQLSGLFHPANKLSGIHNFNASTIYHHETTELKSASNQYTFCSAPTAQAVTITLPDTFNVVDANYEYKLTNGVLKAGGFGDPIGNHRNTSKQFGRGANFTAISQTAIFGRLPEIVLPLRERPAKSLQFTVEPADANVTLTDYAGKVLTPAEGVYALTTANYLYRIEKPGFKTVLDTARLTDASPALTTINVTLQAIDSADTGWDGITTNYAPELVDGWYLIRSGYNLAWFAAQVNGGTYNLKGKLMNDISLGGHNWTPIGGTTSSKAFKGQFDGQNHKIDSLYINATTTYQGLFGYVQNGAISNLTVEGELHSTANYAAGIAAYLNASTMTNCVNRVKVNAASYVGGLTAVANGATTITHCGNQAELTASGNYIGGITANAMSASTVINGCYNWDRIIGQNYVAGIAGNVQNANATIKNVYNVAIISGTGANVGAIRGHATNGKYENIYATKAHAIDTTATVKTVILDAEEIFGGKAAWLLRPVFGQKIGVDPFPVFSADSVYQIGIKEDADTTYAYTNAVNPVDTMWVNNIAAFYWSAGQKVTEIHSDTTVTLMIEVKPLTGAATFEERTLRPESAWYGDPDFEDEENPWNSGDYVFSTYVDDWGSSGIYYYDVTMANITSSDFGLTNPYYDQYSAAGGAAEGNNYAVWYYSWYGPANVQLLEPGVISGMAVTNNAWVVYDILNGDGMSSDGGKPFGKGDWLCLTITGYDEFEDSVSAVNYYLADFRDTVNLDWTYAENWQWVDLTALGNVSAIGFSLTSSKQNTYGMTTPAYFCFDNLGGQASDCRLGALTHVDGHATGLKPESFESQEPNKFLKDGVLYILRQGILYDALGRKVKNN